MNFENLPQVSKDDFTNVLTQMLFNIGGDVDSVPQVSKLQQTNLMWAILLQLEAGGNGGGGVIPSLNQVLNVNPIATNKAIFLETENDNDGRFNCLNILTNNGTEINSRGEILIKRNGLISKILADYLSAEQLFQLPDKSGVFALLSDIPYKLFAAKLSLGEDRVINITEIIDQIGLLYYSQDVTNNPFTTYLNFGSNLNTQCSVINQVIEDNSGEFLRFRGEYKDGEYKIKIIGIDPNGPEKINSFLDNITFEIKQYIS